MNTTTKQIVYSVQGGLSPEQLDRMHRAGLRVLEEVGLDVEFPEILKAITGHPGVRISGQNVRFDPAAVDALVADYRAQRAKAPPSSRDFSIDILSGYAFQVVDIETGAVRPMTTADCIQMGKLVDGLHDQGVKGGTPGMPQDVPVELQEVLAYKISCEQSRTSGHGGFTSLKVAETIERMAEVCGKEFCVPVLTLDLC